MSTFILEIYCFALPPPVLPMCGAVSGSRPPPRGGGLQQLRDRVDRHREDDGAVVFGRDGVECLKVPQLGK